MKKLKTKMIQIEVETNIPNRVFTRMELQAVFNRCLHTKDIITVRQVRVQEAQPAKK